MSRGEREGEPRPARATRRRQIAEMLRERELDFDALRRELGLGARELEEELAHLDRSLRSRGEALAIRPAQCRACGFEPGVRAKRRFHAPRRCPRCKAERMDAPSYRIE